MVAAAMIDRLVHHAEVISSRATATACAAVTSDGFPRPTPGNDQHQLTQWGVLFTRRKWATIQSSPTFARQSASRPDAAASAPA
ncbi:hypothetical protein [Streptomyces sp. NPDC007205]|uniref:hypothetical protein n=1 Tax=Streptomyces sp. NPDC007205 TaxID=3154316 RepID=UPI0033F8E79A